MVKGVLFDMDGLMFDTERMSLEAWRFAGRQLGFAPRDEFLLALRGSMGDEARAKLQREFGPGFDYDRTRQVRLTYADSWIEQHGMPVKPGLLPLLEELKARGIPAALATSTTRPTAWGYLTRAGVKDYFAASVCGGEVERPKPNPDVFLKAAGLLGLDPGTCMVLEDSPNGIAAAHAAGCIPVMVPDLTQPDPALRALCARVVPSLDQVIPLLELL